LPKRWPAIAQTVASGYWALASFESRFDRSLIANLSNNIFDYGAGVIGYDLIIVGNHSQVHIKYRSARPIESVANMPVPQPL
jgi:hypothetical protein